MPLPRRVLIANRGEIAIRIAAAAASLGMQSLALYPIEDTDALHTRMADASVLLPPSPSAPNEPVAAYLNGDAIIQIALQQQCDCIHPGYGFLSENAEFAAQCELAGIHFVGPTTDALQLFGDKTQARSLAKSLDIPVVPGSTGVLSSLQAAQASAAQIGLPVMLKAAAGGGGRGMRLVSDASELADAFERCASEALAAFGESAVFLEKYLPRTQHIEVQILGDQHGNLLHLHERDCSVQLRHQKVIEIAPAPTLSSPLRRELLAAALKLTRAVNYSSAGTVEFLVTPETNEWYFIECNPRIQVEHTVTEQITGIDLIETQFHIAGGATLSECGLANQQAVGAARGHAIQARVVAQGGGTITSYREPSGAGIRVDAAGYSGLTPAAQFDPLLAKVIATAGAPSSYASALRRLQRAIGDFQVGGIATNLPQLTKILAHPALINGTARTSLIAEHPALQTNTATHHHSSHSQRTAASAHTRQSTRDPLLFLQHKATLAGASAVLSDGANIPQTEQLERIELTIEEGQQVATVAMAGVVLEANCQHGARVTAGQTLLIVSAMKMQAIVTAPCSGTIVLTLDIKPGDSVLAGQSIAVIGQDAGALDKHAQQHYNPDSVSWAPTLRQVETLRELAKARFADNSNDPGVLRQRRRGKLTCRERISLLLDDKSFREVGSVAGFASYNEHAQVSAFTPANMVGGQGKINQRPVIVCADDFSSRGGHSDGAIAAKSSYLDRLSIQLRLPSIRLLDGSSGGGSVAAMVPEQKKQGDSAAQESSGAIAAGKPRVAGAGGSFLPGHLGSSLYAEQLGCVPVVNVLLGSVVGLGAAKAVMGHFSVMVKDLAQLFVAGPPVVRHAMGYEISKEELGGWHIHCRNGAVDNLADSEPQAMAMTRRFLSYLPPSVYESAAILPPCPDDLPNRREAELLSIIPRTRTTAFDMRRVIELLADRDSFFEIGRYWGCDQIVGFTRFNGYPLAVIASDSQHRNGGALTADGCDKLKRHLDLCDLFHIPVLNLVDNPGFAVGLEHEIAATIRKGGEWMVAFAQIKVPIFTVITRRSFGVAGNNYATPRAEPCMRVVWPAADAGGIPPEGGIEAAYKRQLAEADDPIALRAELAARIESARGPLGPLSQFQMEEMIDPADTRSYICDWLEIATRVATAAANLVPRALQYRP